MTAVLSPACFAHSGAAEAESTNNTKAQISVNGRLRTRTDNHIALRIGEEVFSVDLYDDPTAEGLSSRLPLVLKANDYRGYDEKVIRLPSGLSMEGARPGDDPGIPEVGYYEPGQRIALYCGPIGYWPGKVPLGRIHANRG